MTHSPKVQEALDRIGVTDGRQIKIQHIVDLCSEIKNLDKEAQKELISMLPAVQGKILEAYVSFRDIACNVLESNDESEKQVYGIYKDVLQSIDDELKDPNISEERRRELSEERKEYVRLAHSKDTEGKEFKKILAQYGLFGVFVVAAPFACAVGAKINVK